MSKTIIGLFDGADRAQMVVQELKREGLSDAQTYGPAGGTTGSIQGQLTSAGVPRDEADHYADGVRNGGTLVLVRTDDSRANRAVQIMERHNTPGAGAGAGAARSSASNTGVPRAPGRAAGNQIREEVVEEEVSIGKRPVERPAARVSSEVTERPVEEKVQLHEEQVHIDRRKADRPASEEDLRPHEDIVIQERSEEPVVQKRARVVGEVVVSKEARDRTETIREKVRRKDVHVDKEPGGAAPGYGSLESDFREHHRKHDHSGLDYADAAPAYRFGLDLADSRRFKGKDWSKIKADVRSDWEKYNPGTWNDAEHAVRYGWDRGHGRR